jgi:hypothetical protein
LDILVANSARVEAEMLAGVELSVDGGMAQV